MPPQDTERLLPPWPGAPFSPVTLLKGAEVRGGMKVEFFCDGQARCSGQLREILIYSTNVFWVSTVCRALSSLPVRWHELGAEAKAKWRVQPYSPLPPPPSS